MLTFFRKHQKVIFIFTTAVIVVSFSFFGTMSSMGGVSEVKEDPFIKAIDGSSVSLRGFPCRARDALSSSIRKSGGEPAIKS